MLEVTADEVFKVYMTSKTQGWFRRWGCDAAAASPGPGAAPNGAGSGGAGALTPARLPAPDASDDEGALIMGCGDAHTTSPTLTLETLPAEGRA